MSNNFIRTESKITFIDNFNRELQVSDIPSDITHVTFGENFNQLLRANVIPSSVTHLKFGRAFNQQLYSGDIPSSIIYLKFGFEFNQPLWPGIIPEGVQIVKFGAKFRRKLKNILPKSVTDVKFYNPYNLLDDIDHHIVVHNKHIIPVNFLKSGFNLIITKFYKNISVNNFENSSCYYGEYYYNRTVDSSGPKYFYVRHELHQRAVKSARK